MTTHNGMGRWFLIRGSILPVKCDECGYTYDPGSEIKREPRTLYRQIWPTRTSCRPCLEKEKS